MKQLPSGMYQVGDSVLHNMRAATKIAGFLLLTVCVIRTHSIAGYGILLLLAGLLICAAKINVKTAFGFAHRMGYFLAIIFVMNVCFYGPENPWVRLWIFAPSYEGLIQGTNIVARIVFILAYSNILMTTTAPLAMTEGIEVLLTPLKLIRIPVEQIAMILSVAMQFIPILLEEADMIKKAQTARGVRFDSKKLKDKAMAALPLVIPIFLSAFKRADELSLAMEARGYRTEKQKKNEGKKHEQNDNR